MTKEEREQIKNWITNELENEYGETGLWVKPWALAEDAAKVFGLTPEQTIDVVMSALKEGAY